MSLKSKKFWYKVSLKKEKSLGIIFLDNNELLSPEGKKLYLPYNLSKKVFKYLDEVLKKHVCGFTGFNREVVLNL